MIHRISIDSKIYVAKAAKIEEIEYAGEYCMIPWIRVYDVIEQKTIECPRHKVDFIEYY